MKAQGAAFQGALAVVGLAAAYMAWQREPDTTSTEVTVLDVSKNSISAVSYDDPKQHVELTRGEDNGEPVTWFTVTPKDAPTAPSDAGSHDGGVRDAGSPSPAVAASVPKKIRQFRGNELADKLWEKFSPLRGTRALGVLDPAKLKEVGLDKPDRSLTVAASGARYDFEVGTAAQGVVNPYFREAKDGKVYLVKGTLLSDFEFASSRLVDRRLHIFKPEDFDEVHVKAGDASREFVTLPEGKLAPKATPSSPDTFVKNWSDKVFHLIVTEVLGKDEAPPGGTPPAELRVEYFGRGKLVGWVEVGRSGADIYGRTEHTAGWMKLPANSNDALIEAKKVVTGG